MQLNHQINRNFPLIFLMVALISPILSQPLMAKTISKVPQTLIAATADGLAEDFLALPGIVAISAGNCRPSGKLGSKTEAAVKDPIAFGIRLFWDSHELMSQFNKRSLLIKLAPSLTARILLCSSYTGKFGPHPGFTVVNPGKGGANQVAADEQPLLNPMISIDEWNEKYARIFPTQMNFTWEDVFKNSDLELNELREKMLKEHADLQVPKSW